MFEPVDKNVRFPAREEALLDFWDKQEIFRKTEEQRAGAPEYVFYDGPPGTNGVPHIGHMMQSALKDLWPRFKIMQGYHVIRKAGWDTHGLPIELTAEKELKLASKRDIQNYGVEKYIDYCRSTVFRYMGAWEQAIRRSGRFLDMKNAYMTLSNDYIQSDWYLLKLAWERKLEAGRVELAGRDVSPRFLYKDYRIMPYCARCGTTLSNFEVAEGYKDVKDMTLTARFPVDGLPGHFFAAWTTTAWTLLSNVALAVGPDIDYVAARLTEDAEGGKAGEVVILAQARLEAYRKQLGSWEILWTKKGSELAGMRYHPLWDWQRNEKAHVVLADDYVTTEDGAGIVHLALYGEDDFRIIRREGLPLVQNVDETGHTRPQTNSFAGRYFRDEALDVDIIRDLAARGLLLHKEKHEHAYPFCYRCDAALMYFARPGWFLRTASYREEMLKANSYINWQPPFIKEGRFGNWLENTIDWNVTRERYWGSPLPVWTCRRPGCDGEICAGSLDELRALAGPDLDRILYNEKTGGLDLHKPLIDRVKIPCPRCGETMERENFVLDSWFNAGLMFIGQWGYPAAPGSPELIWKQYPADFICEAIDQTRGWFYTLLACSTLFALGNDLPERDWSCYRNVICTDLVLDEEGRKMSKSRGNVVDPIKLFNDLGADATRWVFYASNPWNVKRFSAETVREAVRDVILPLWNAYSFFVTYARVDGWTPEPDPPASDHPLDRWLMSELAILQREVTRNLETYDVAPAAAAITRFLDQLTNWYIRRSRRRFWKSGDDQDKRGAYATLYRALTDFTLMLAPFLPFITEEIYQNLVRSVNPQAPESVHLCRWPVAAAAVDEELSRRMDLARRVVRSGRDLRQKHGAKVRQPLRQISVVLPGTEGPGLESLADLVADELNVRQVNVLADDSQLVTLKAQPNFRALGPRFGKEVNQAAEAIRALSPELVGALDRGETVTAGEMSFQPGDVTIERAPLENWAASSEEGLTVALDLNMTEELLDEGRARELVHLIQNLRRAADLEVTDRIRIHYQTESEMDRAVQAHRNWIQTETLAVELTADGYKNLGASKPEKIDRFDVYLTIERV
ncbi:MAG: isoleucine--tRNA ligase [Candidatus Zixiibacteriota bacterium]|nr:MAG: isoleucine--tRNA ligase [candidate division Zixibacteria bacterium]